MRKIGIGEKNVEGKREEIRAWVAGLMDKVKGMRSEGHVADEE